MGKTPDREDIVQDKINLLENSLYSNQAGKDLSGISKSIKENNINNFSPEVLKALSIVTDKTRYIAAFFSLFPKDFAPQNISPDDYKWLSINIYLTIGTLLYKTRRKHNFYSENTFVHVESKGTPVIFFKLPKNNGLESVIDFAYDLNQKVNNIVFPPFGIQREIFVKFYLAQREGTIASQFSIDFFDFNYRKNPIDAISRLGVSIDDHTCRLLGNYSSKYKEIREELSGFANKKLDKFHGIIIKNYDDIINLDTLSRQYSNDYKSILMKLGCPGFEKFILDMKDNDKGKAYLEERFEKIKQELAKFDRVIPEIRYI